MIDRLIQLMTEKDITKAQLARHCGVTAQAVGQWFNKGNISKENLIKVANLLGVSVEYIATGKQEAIGQGIVVWDEESDLDPDHYVFIPRYNIHVSGGNGAIIYDITEKDKKESFRRGWLQDRKLNPQHLKCLSVAGDSMEPVMPDGCSITIDDSQTKVYDKKVYVLRYGEEIKVKLLFNRPDGGLIIKSYNQGSYPDVVVTGQEMEHIEIVGKVVHVACDMY